MLKEFKAFAMRGNIVDLAVGVIIGVAFGKVVSSLVEDLMMPPIGRLLGHVDFSGLFINLERQALRNAGDRESSRRPDRELWNFSELGDQLSDRGVCRIPDRP